jgi:hypothetical protein
VSDFNQPLCNRCWFDRNNDRQPARIIQKVEERCCLCASATTSGIYFRVDPKTVPYPTLRSSQ